MAHDQGLPSEAIAGRIFEIRGHRVMLDSDLASLYGVSTGRLNEQVRRNLDRFPGDFAFRLTPDEMAALISQIAISNTGRGGRRKLPMVFTEYGAVMLASVLSSPMAVRASIQVTRAFIRLRQAIASNVEMAHRLDELERKYDAQFKVVFDAIRQLMEPTPELPKGRIGFQKRKT